MFVTKSVGCDSVMFVHESVFPFQPINQANYCKIDLLFLKFKQLCLHDLFKFPFIDASLPSSSQAHPAKSEQKPYMYLVSWYTERPRIPVDIWGPISCLVGIARNFHLPTGILPYVHQTFQVPKMEVLTYICCMAYVRENSPPK